MVSAYIVILLCRYQHEQLRLSITSFPLSCFPFIYLLLIFTLYYCSNQYLIGYWVGGLRLNYLIPQAFLIPSGFPLASPVLLRCSSYLCSIYECECVCGNTKVCFSNIPVPVCVCVHVRYVCVCVCSVSGISLCVGISQSVIFPQVSQYHDKWARYRWDNHNSPTAIYFHNSSLL